MKRDATLKWAKLIGCSISSTGRTGWIVCDCPLQAWKHDNGKSGPEVFGIKIESGDAFSNCYACGWHGKQSELLIEMKRLNKLSPKLAIPFNEALQQVLDAEEASELNLDSPDIEEMLFGNKNQTHVFPEWWLESFPLATDIPWAMAYLQGGRPDADPLPLSVIQALDLRADTEQKRICFPVRDFANKLRGLHGRAVDHSVEPRYRMYLQAGQKNPDIWLGESWIDLEKPIVVVEGPFDLASVYRVYRNVTTPLYANPSIAKLKRMMGASEWVTLLDRGGAGDAGRAKIKAECKDQVVHHLLPPEGVKDPGAMSLAQLQEVVGSLLPLDDPLA